MLGLATSRPRGAGVKHSRQTRHNGTQSKSCSRIAHCGVDYAWLQFLVVVAMPRHCYVSSDISCLGGSYDVPRRSLAIAYRGLVSDGEVSTKCPGFACQLDGPPITT